ncbi:MAG: GNAT family N-acetyltransferase [Acidimicrobiia bacterium]|nr:GNAT family N-acetyltransferase [Acidimicrobiia bacterium]NNL27519.1 GNAT family N-acetyltransferase [Acidimicrobiia bacterium]
MNDALGSTDVDRSIAFARRHHKRLADTIIDFRWGSAFLEEDVPLRYGSNFLWVDGSPDDVTAEELVLEADEILGGAGFKHRIVAIDDPVLSRRLRSGFEAAGWSLTELVTMVLPDPANATRDLRPGVHAREAEYSQTRNLLELLQHTYDPPRSPETVRTLVDYPAKLAAAVGARFFVAESDGVLAAICDLYIDGSEAQIESVNTLPEYRNRGLGTAVMHEAIAAAVAEGVTWIHLYAEANDWPRQWYEKLGFSVVGSYNHFHLYPER